MARKGLLSGVATKIIDRARAARTPSAASTTPVTAPRKPVAAAPNPADRMARLARITTGKPRGRMK